MEKRLCQTCTVAFYGDECPNGQRLDENGHVQAAYNVVDYRLGRRDALDYWGDVRRRRR